MSRFDIKGKRPHSLKRKASPFISERNDLDYRDWRGVATIRLVVLVTGYGAYPPIQAIEKE